jgi:hypothetical protein
MIAPRPIAVTAVFWCVCAGATASASPEPVQGCRIEWRANASGGHDLDDACLPALSSDGKRLLVTRMESGSFSFLVLSVPGKGRVLRRLSAVDLAMAAEVAKTIRAVNQLLARDGYRALAGVELPRSKDFVLSHGALELRSQDDRLEAWCGQDRVGRARKLGAVNDDSLGPHHEVLSALFLPDPATFALLKVEPVDNKRGFYLPGFVEWIIVPFSAPCP